MSQSAFPLAGLKVLVTRPEPQASELASKLEQQGAVAVVAPMLAIEPFTEEAPEQQTLPIKDAIVKLDQFQHLIFISTNAARWGCHWVTQYWPQWPAGQRVYAIGEATGSALRQYGVGAVAGTDSMNSEELLALPALQAVAQDKILIFRGVGGREHLAQELRQRGAEVSYCEVYRRTCPHYRAGELAARIRDQQVSVVSINSSEALSNFCASLAPGELSSITTGITLLVPGERVTQAAKERGFRYILAATNATDAATITALQDWWAEQRGSHSR